MSKASTTIELARESTVSLALNRFDRGNVPVAGLIHISLIHVAPLAAWCLLIVWDRSELSAYLHHGDWTQLGLLASLCSAIALNEPIHAVFYACSWLLMVVAMMFPVASPHLFNDAFQMQKLPGSELLAACGYLVPWMVFGSVAHILGYVLNEVASMNYHLSYNGWIAESSLFLIAGFYQFSEAKIRYLQKCGSQNGFFSDSDNRLTAEFKRGYHYGINCLVCCWPIMLLMFVFWPGSLMWMLLLTLLMVIDRVSTRIRKSIGLCFLVTSAWSILNNVL